jgi:hypothetical protein
LNSGESQKQFQSSRTFSERIFIAFETGVTQVVEFAELLITSINKRTGSNPEYALACSHRPASFFASQPL